jgi:hypothetical protein
MTVTLGLSVFAIAVIARVLKTAARRRAESAALRKKNMLRAELARMKAQANLQLERQIRSRQGQLAIFREKRIICPVLLESFHYNDWGLTLTLRWVDKPGFTAVWAADGETFHVSASAEMLGIGPKSWSSMYVGWTLYVDTEVVDAAIKLAAGLDPRAPVLDRWKRLSEELNEYL